MLQVGKAAQRGAQCSPESVKALQGERERCVHRLAQNSYRYERNACMQFCFVCIREVINWSKQGLQVSGFSVWRPEDISFLMMCYNGGQLQCGVYAELCSMWAICNLLSDTTCGRSEKLTRCLYPGIHGCRGLTRPCKLAKILAMESSEPGREGVAFAVGLPGWGCPCRHGD